jgi:transposase
MSKSSKSVPEMTIGVDLGDRFSHLCVLDQEGEVLEEGRVATTPEAFRRRFESMSRCRVVLEVGTHSPWVSRLLEDCGHETIVANPRQVRLIAESHDKHDRLDAERLARLARIDVRILGPVQHRSEETQCVRAQLQGRDVLVRTRTLLINHVRGTVKAVGGRLKGCSATSFHKQAGRQIPAVLQSALEPVLEVLAVVTQIIRQAERRIEQVARDKYPETTVLRQVAGVGPLTSLAFVVTLEDPNRFRSSRAVGAYLGMTPRRRQSGDSDPELRISKRGDPHLRRLVVSAAHYILGPFGPDTDLRRWGLALAARGRKRAKKKAIVAVARKLAVLLHRLWLSGEVYEPLRHSAAAA